MKLATRKAAVADVPRLWELRRESILKLAPTGMSAQEVEQWAAKLTIEGWGKRFRESEIWLAEAGGFIVGWVAIRGDYLDGLYTDPQFAGQGIGTELLSLAETLAGENGVQIMRLDASRNSEEFYLHRGYEPAGPRPSDGGIPLCKRLPLIISN